MLDKYQMEIGLNLLCGSWNVFWWHDTVDFLKEYRRNIITHILMKSDLLMDIIS